MLVLAISEVLVSEYDHWLLESGWHSEGNSRCCPIRENVRLKQVSI
jgi:hypothetical protein